MNKLLSPIFISILLSLATSTGISASPKSPQDKKGSGTSISQQDKARACNDLAEKKGLKGEDRKNFLQDCLSKTSSTKSIDDMSQKEKLDACRNLADKRNLKGEDRRSFLKDCLNRVNSR